MISSLLVISGDICQILCYFVHDCVSFNLGISETGDHYICQLNNSTDQVFLQRREKYTYHETQVSVKKFQLAYRVFSHEVTAAILVRYQYDQNGKIPLLDCISCITQVTLKLIN